MQGRIASRIASQAYVCPSTWHFLLSQGVGCDECGEYAVKKWVAQAHVHFGRASAVYLCTDAKRCFESLECKDESHLASPLKHPDPRPCRRMCTSSALYLWTDAKRWTWLQTLPDLLSLLSWGSSNFWWGLSCPGQCEGCLGFFVACFVAGFGVISCALPPLLTPFYRLPLCPGERPESARLPGT